jgi:hypothetical protein
MTSNRRRVASEALSRQEDFPVSLVLCMWICGNDDVAQWTAALGQSNPMFSTNFHAQQYL